MGSLTTQQRRAVEATGEVLVMAGAGAGKTSTLVARVLDRVLEGEGRVSLDRVLVVTFNEAAAAEMRHRMQRSLEDRLQATPDDAWLAEQAALLETAMVSTLHGFCLRLIREHFHELSLDPQFAVQDPMQTRILRGQVLGEVLRACHSGVGSEAEALRTFLGRHGQEGDGVIQALVLRIHEYARSLPEGMGWLRRVREGCARQGAGEWRGLVLPGLRRWAASWLGDVERLTVNEPEGFSGWESLSVLRGAPSLEAGGVAGFLEALVRAGESGRFEKGQPGYRKKKYWREPIEELFDEGEELRSMLVPSAAGGGDPLEEDWGWARVDLGALLGLVERFDEAFAAARRSAAVVDFSDLEQMALRLLWDAERGVPTPLAEGWRRRFDHVLVDEYQDINGAQDRILRCVSREGEAASRFFVGDVKQSIYRFRRAAPAIFQGYARDWREGRGRSVIPLAENFRSHEAILGFVNELFARVMRPGVGGVAYDDEARLLFGAAETRTVQRERPEGRVELHLVVRGGESGAEGAGGVESGAGEEGAGAEPAWGDLDIEERQAEVAARRLKELLESGVGVWDSRLGAERLVTWRDMVVLHPAPGPVSERWARSFARVGVPLEARRGGFFRALEVADLVNVARMLDNPLQDHPVLAVLRSPMVGLGVDELAAIRLMDRRGRFWEAVERCAAGDPLPGEWAEVPEVRAALATARGRLRWFLEGFRRWRLLARQGSVTRCLEAVLVETAYEAWLRAQPRAEARLANVRRLLALTRQFDQAQRRGLYRFLRFVEAQAETGEEMESAQAAAGDSVRLMSMHQSKGLEFPVVVAAGLGRKFNLRDLREEWLLDEEYGLCPPVLAPGRVRGYPSLPRWLAGRRQLTEALGEQTRLFYVACTRAADRLLLLGAVRDATLAKWSGTSPRFTDRDLLRVGEPLGWLGPLMSELTGQSGWVESETGRGRWLDWRLHRGAPVPVPAGVGEESGGESEAAGAGVAGEEIGAEVVEAIRGRLEWRYEREAATQLPAKTAVTALRRQWALDEEAVVADPDLVNRPAVRSDEASAPVSRDAVTRGLVHHLFFEQLDLAGPLDLPDLEQQRERLVLAGWLGREAAALIDLEGVAAFWSTEAGSVLRQERSAVQRELPFTARLSRREALLLGAPGTMAGWSEEDFQVIQGVADLVLFRPGELWIVDYKTDRVEGAAIAERTAKYEAQLRLYAHALSGVYRVPVTRRLLWFIHPRQLVEVT